MMDPIVSQEEYVLIDTHCHLDFEWFDGERASVVQRARQARVERIIVPSLDLTNVEAVLGLAGRFDAVYAAVGVHPNSSASWQDSWIDNLRHFASHPKVVAIGEIGLDYYRDLSPKEHQWAALESQLELASDLNLPVILHNRESNDDLLEMLSESSIISRGNPGVLHSFMADRKSADRALDLGFFLGFTGPVTYKNSETLRQIARTVPLDRILVETDAPFLSPQRKRGKRNEPANVVEIAECLADIRDLPLIEMAQNTTANAAELFGKAMVNQES